MTIIYLLITLSAIAIIGGWNLAVAIRLAEEGYEDATGFVLGGLPALPVAVLRAQPAFGSAAKSDKAPPAAASHFSTGTATQSVTIFVSASSRTASPLYHRYRRSGTSSNPFASQSASPFSTQSAHPFATQSASPFPTQSASPFAIPCAAVRSLGTTAGSTPPIPPATQSPASERPAN